jgi:hypothetical protein
MIFYKIKKEKTQTLFLFLFYFIIYNHKFIMWCLITVHGPPMPGYNTQGYLLGNKLQGPCIKEMSTDHRLSPYKDAGANANANWHSHLHSYSQFGDSSSRLLTHMLRLPPAHWKHLLSLWPDVGQGDP